MAVSQHLQLAEDPVLHPPSFQRLLPEFAFQGVA